MNLYYPSLFSLSLKKVRNFTIRFFCCPLLPVALAVASLGVIIFVPLHNLDVRFTDYFYQNGIFIWKGRAIPEFIHKYLKFVIILVFLPFVIIPVLSFFKAGIFVADRDLLKRCGLILISLSLSLFSVALLKQINQVSCPWNLSVYGGEDLYLTPFHGFFNSSNIGVCWPSGFAGTGFVLMSGWAGMQGRYPKLAYSFLFTALLLGFLAGLVQIGRGAHFPSHVIATLDIDFLISYGVSKLCSSTR